MVNSVRNLGIAHWVCVLARVSVCLSASVSGYFYTVCLMSDGTSLLRDERFRYGIVLKWYMFYFRR